MAQSPFDVAFNVHFGATLKVALDLIQNEHEHAGGFVHLANRLEKLEETHPEYVWAAKTQEQLRLAVKMLWDAFVRESKNRDKMSQRMDAHKPTEVEVQKAMAASREPSRSDFRRYLSQMPEADRKRWAENRRGSVVRREIINGYLDRITSPIADAYEGSRRQIFYMGALYNHALPQITKLVHGMAQQLFPSKSTWLVALGIAAPEPKRIPVTSRTIRAEIADFLAFAERFALELAEIQLKRDKVRETLND